MEIGTWNGNNSLKMIETALKNNEPSQVEYYGFDLFEEASTIILDDEFAKGKPPTMNAIKSKLEKTGARIHLYKGNTKEVLPEVIDYLPHMDFVFIDGGHSIETIENDWYYTQKVMSNNTIVIFDDYYNIDDVGCKKTIESINEEDYEIQILEPKDIFTKSWGVLEINFVKIKRKK